LIRLDKVKGFEAGLTVSMSELDPGESYRSSKFEAGSSKKGAKWKYSSIDIRKPSTVASFANEKQSTKRSKRECF
jgi:hypothetical protein